MDQNVTMTEVSSSKKTSGHFSKCKHVYIFILSILLIAGLLFGAFQLDMSRTEDTETENEKKQGYIAPIGLDITRFENKKRQEIQEEYNRQLSKESAFLMLISLDEVNPVVQEYRKNTVWARLERDNPDLTILAAKHFGFTDEAYSALHSFFFDRDESGIAAITPLGTTTEAYLEKLHEARNFVETKEKTIVRPLNPADPADQKEIDEMIDFYILNLLIWNPSASPDNDVNASGTSASIATLSSLMRILAILVAVVAFLIIIAKTSGQYSIGFSFPSQTGWLWAVIIMLPFLVLGTLYGLMGNLSSTMYQIFIALFMAVFIAFGCFALRKAGAGKALRVLVPLLSTYAVFGLFYFLTSNYQYLFEYAKERVDHFTAFELMTYELPHFVFFALFVLAPLFMVAIYTLTNSIIAMIIPTLFVNIFGAVFPAMIQVTNVEFYVSLYLLLLALYVVATLVMYAVIIVKGIKKIPLGGDLLCEHYAEGAPEVTFPEAYLAKKEQKKAAKEAKKANDGDFEFLKDNK